MSTPPIPFNTLLQLVRVLAHRYRDRQTEGIYWDYAMDQPESIVGTALYGFGIEVPLRDNTRPVMTMPWAGMGFTDPLGPQLRWLQIVQEQTNAGKTWDVAVAHADNRFPLLVKVA